MKSILKILKILNKNINFTLIIFNYNIIKLYLND